MKHRLLAVETSQYFSAIFFRIVTTLVLCDHTEMSVVNNLLKGCSRWKIIDNLIDENKVQDIIVPFFVNYKI